MLKVLAIGAHADDIPLGMGATLAKLTSEDSVDEHDTSIHTLTFSCRETQPDPSSPEEEIKALKILGVLKENIHILNFITTVFPEKYIEIRDMLRTVDCNIEPDVIFTHIKDLHQDHRIVAQESYSVFRDRTVLSYEIHNSSTNFNPNLFVPVNEKHIDRKIQALKVYKTQQNKLYFSPEAIRSLAVMRGVSIRRKFAEAFEVFRIVGEIF